MRPWRTWRAPWRWARRTSRITSSRSSPRRRSRSTRPPTCRMTTRASRCRRPARRFWRSRAMRNTRSRPMRSAGAHCEHNLVYWRFGDYLGVGAGAHGKVTVPAAPRIARTVRSAPSVGIPRGSRPPAARRPSARVWRATRACRSSTASTRLRLLEGFSLGRVRTVGPVSVGPRCNRAMDDACRARPPARRRGPLGRQSHWAGASSTSCRLYFLPV